MRCGICGHAGVNDGQIVLNAESLVLDRAGNGQKKFSLSVGKDEVGGSNPPSSSRITPEIFGFRVFSFAFRNFLAEYDFAEFC